MIDLRFVPLRLAAFPGGARPTEKRRASSVFSSTYERTLDRLETELEKLQATDIVVQAGYETGDIRNDGWPRASAKPSHPAVVLSFRSRQSKREYSFPCDTFTRFEHNLHAIAFTLEALRAVNRYGVTRGHEQYKGFAQIEAPRKMTVEMAGGFIGHFTPSVDVLASAENYRSAYRVAAKRLHPDSGGEPALWHKLGEAKELLDAHFGLSRDQTA